MPIFKCDECHCVENTALCDYWSRNYGDGNGRALCSGCDPEIGELHVSFGRRDSAGMLVGDDGFLYPLSQVKSKEYYNRRGIKIVGVVMRDHTIVQVSKKLSHYKMVTRVKNILEEGRLMVD